MIRSDLLGLLVLLVLSTALAACAKPEKTATPSNTPGVLIISYRPDSADTFVANRPDSVIALGWLREVAKTHEIALEVKSFPFGILVERIGPRQNGDGGFWLYKVNGQMIPKSSDAHPVAWSDTVTFFFDER